MTQLAAGGEAAPPPPDEEAPTLSEPLDERTVAYLARSGWFETEEYAERLLRGASGRTGARFPFETAKAAADWLEAVLGSAPQRDQRPAAEALAESEPPLLAKAFGFVLPVADWLGVRRTAAGPAPPKEEARLCPAARAVKSELLLLTLDVATLQRKWDALMQPPNQGGVGCMLSEEQTREVVCKHPQLLTCAMEDLSSRWSRLTSALTEGGLGLSDKDARACVIRIPRALSTDSEKFIARVELLRGLGYAGALNMVLTQPSVLSFAAETVIEHADWWWRTGLDHVTMLTTHPTLLGSCAIAELQPKLDFLRSVAKLSDGDLNHSPTLFSASLEDTLRPRFFYALQHGALEPYQSSTFLRLMYCSSERFLRRVHGHRLRLGEAASAEEVERFKETVSSPPFMEWAAREEERIRRGRGKPRLIRLRTDAAPGASPLSQ